MITSAGLSRRATRSVWLGVEAVGEDLEGLSDPNEAEGGAKLMVGPTIALIPAARMHAT